MFVAIRISNLLEHTRCEYFFLQLLLFWRMNL